MTLPAELILMTAGLLTTLKDVLSLSLVSKRHHKILLEDFLSKLAINVRAQKFFELFTSRMVKVAPATTSFYGQPLSEIHIYFGIPHGSQHELKHGTYEIYQVVTGPSLINMNGLQSATEHESLINLAKSQGFLYESKQYRNNKQHGKLVTFFCPSSDATLPYPLGLPYNTCDFVDDLKHGEWLLYERETDWSKPYLIHTEKYVKGERHGPSESYDYDTHKLKSRTWYHEGVLKYFEKYDCDVDALSRKSNDGDDDNDGDGDGDDAPEIMILFMRGYWTGTKPKNDPITQEYFHPNGVMSKLYIFKPFEGKREAYWLISPADRYQWRDDGILMKKSIYINEDDHHVTDYYEDTGTKKEEYHVMRREGMTDESEKHGVCEGFSKDGRLCYRQNWFRNKLHGLQEEYDEAGSLVKVTEQKFGRPVKNSKEAQLFIENYAKQQEKDGKKSQ